MLKTVNMLISVKPNKISSLKLLLEWWLLAAKLNEVKAYSNRCMR